MYIHLRRDDKKPTSNKRDVAAIERFDDINNTHGIGRTRSKCTPSICKDGNEHMLLHVEGTRVERECPGPKTGYPELGMGKDRCHEATDGEGGHLDGDLGYNQGFGPIGEELVEEGEEGTWQYAQEPHPEGPYGEGRIVGVGHG